MGETAIETSRTATGPNAHENLVYSFHAGSPENAAEVNAREQRHALDKKRTRGTVRQPTLVHRGTGEQYDSQFWWVELVPVISLAA